MSLTITKKQVSLLIIRTVLFFIVLLCNIQSQASNGVVYLSQDSIDEVYCTQIDCFFPNKVISNQDIYVNGEINWSRDRNLVLHTKGNIIFERGAKITIDGDTDVSLMAGMEPGSLKKYKSTVKFDEVDQIEINGNGKVKIYYNPDTKKKSKHKYQDHALYGNILPNINLETYMLVNDVYDLQGITGCLFGSYALSQNIDASPTRNWSCDENQCLGFYPIMEYNQGGKKTPFSGTFDGNGYTISDLYINRPEERNVGLFGDITGINRYKSTVVNVTIKNSDVIGKHCVGILAGQATGVMFNNVHIVESKYRSLDAEYGEIDKIAKSGAGCVIRNIHQNITVTEGNATSRSDEDFFGSCVKCEREKN